MYAVLVGIVLVYITTALHSACATGAHNSASVLLANSADPNIVDNWQQTGLFAAAEGGHAECILKVYPIVYPYELIVSNSFVLLLCMK